MIHGRYLSNSAGKPDRSDLIDIIGIRLPSPDLSLVIQGEQAVVIASHFNCQGQLRQSYDFSCWLTLTGSNMNLTFLVRCHEAVLGRGNAGVGRGVCVKQSWCIPVLAPSVDAVIPAQGRIAVPANYSTCESHLARRISG